MLKKGEFAYKILKKFKEIFWDEVLVAGVLTDKFFDSQHADQRDREY